jgi:putative transcriptional regulator
MMETQRLPYTLCGLDGVYLLNGFKYKETPRGRRLHIDDQEGLHQAIGRHLVRQGRGLTGRELRFLREELGLSQTSLARLLGESEQSVARREKREKPYKRPPSQERMIRYLYEEKHINENEKLADFLKGIADADDFREREITLDSDPEWHIAVLAAEAA